MKKFVLIPDSFKGTLSSAQVCAISEKKIKEFYPQAQVISIPVADGGEGSVDCFLSATSGQKIIVGASGPYFEKIDAFYGIIEGGDTAVIEMAACAGLPMVEGRKNPLKTTTFGVGELILDAIKRGVKRVIIGLGGSCTNDFGVGMACALGVKFYDKNGNEFIPTGGSLIDVEKIDIDGVDLKDVEFITMCDIDNPPYGKKGAAHVFAPQKGANEEQVEFLDLGVKHLCDLIKKDFGVDLSTLKGGGAAGAMGAGTAFFLGSKLKMGIDTVLDTVDFDNIISGADLIITGEGKIDGQSLRGKVVIGVAKRAKKQNVPVISVVGGAEGDMLGAYEQGVSAVFTINKMPQDFSISKFNSASNLEFAIENIIRLIKAVK